MKTHSQLKSIFFFSLHKCATSFFTHSVLPLALEHQHVDYQTVFYLNESITPDIRSSGQVYGVIRIADAQHPVFNLTQELIAAAKCSDYNIIIMVRDPRDILVSMYFSFGLSHGLSPNLKLREYQIKRREQVKKMSIDDYVLSETSTLKMKFSKLNELIAKPNSLVLRYEDLINNYDQFYSAFSSVLSLQADVRKKLFDETRPNLVENPLAHKRSGKIYGFSEKLTTQTIQTLNEDFAHILEQFGYPLLNDLNYK